MALFITVGVYLVVGFSALAAAGPERLGGGAAPLSTAVHAAGAGGLSPVVRAGGALAALGALLALIAGVGRTGLAMARDRELPGWLSAVHPRHHVPYRAEIAIAVVVGVLVLTVDLRGMIGFSSFGVLVYYAIANAAAFTQPPGQRRRPRAVNVLGCLVLVVTLPPYSLMAGLGVFVSGLGGRLVALRARRVRP